MAKFIVVDGLDGCGKATQTELLKEALEKLGKRVIKISFPNYESDSSAPVRMYLGGELGSNPEKLNPYMCSSFYAVDRFIQYEVDWRKYFAEDDNTIIIADRYLSANIIHQGGKIANDEDRLSYARWCYDYEHGLCGLPKEDITIILTVDPEVSQRLMTGRYNGDEAKKDIHESNINYLTDCYNRLQTTCKQIHDNNIATWIELDCTEVDKDTGEKRISTKASIHAKIMSYITKILQTS